MCSVRQGRKAILKARFPHSSESKLEFESTRKYSGLLDESTNTSCKLKGCEGRKKNKKRTIPPTPVVKILSMAKVNIRKSDSHRAAIKKLILR